MNSKKQTKRPANAPRASRKDLQLCKQVQRCLQLTLGDFGDEVLSGLIVEAVVPAPNAAQLLVMVQPLLPSDSVTTGETLKRLHARVGQLRNEIARAINRKKTPQLIFQVNATPLTAVEDSTTDSGGAE